MNYYCWLLQSFFYSMLVFSSYSSQYSAQHDPHETYATVAIARLSLSSKSLSTPPSNSSQPGDVLFFDTLFDIMEKRQYNNEQTVPSVFLTPPTTPPSDTLDNCRTIINNKYNNDTLLFDAEYPEAPSKIRFK